MPDFGRLLPDVPATFPRPDLALTDAVRRSLIHGSRPPRVRRRLGLGAGLAIAVVAGVGFTAGYSFAPGHRSRAPSALVAANWRSRDVPVAVRCASQAYVVYLDPEGKVTVLEYTLSTPAHPKPEPTGRVLAYVDATARQLSRECAQIHPRKLRTAGFVGPYARSPQSRVDCGHILGGYSLVRSVQILVRPVLNRSRR